MGRSCEVEKPDTLENAKPVKAVLQVPVSANQ
jgi:hypothetical protein